VRVKRYFAQAKNFLFSEFKRGTSAAMDYRIDGPLRGKPIPVRPIQPIPAVSNK
jgi:hypothetical protein